VPVVPEATIRKFRIVRREGKREVSRSIEHYNLDVILAIGYRLRSPRGIQFRRHGWPSLDNATFVVYCSARGEIDENGFIGESA